MTSIISIIIINRNTQALLATCLDSVNATIPPIPYETIIVDNGSTDSSLEFIHSLGSAVHLIQNQNNLGLAKAVNQAIAVATGKYLLILNTDIILTEKAVAQLVDFMENNPDAGIVGGQLLNPDGSNQNSIAPFPSLPTELIGKSFLRLLSPRKYYHKHLLFTAPVAVDSLVGAVMLVQKEALNQVGVMDDRFFFFYEETDWCKRFSDQGYKIYFLPTVRIIHKQGQSISVEKKGRARIEYAISRYLYFKKHFSAIARILLRSGLIIKLTIELISNLLFGVVSLFLIPSVRNRLRLAGMVFAWHLSGCPINWGLRK